MRNKDDLFELEKISVLLQYLYIDKDAYIQYNNGLTDLKVYMDEDFHIWSINMHFPDLPPMSFEPSVNHWLGIIDKLKETPPARFTWFKNQWEEVAACSSANVSLNHWNSKNRGY